MSMTQAHTSAVITEPSAADRTDLVLDFPTGLPGFPGPRKFCIEPLGPTLEPFCRMRSLDTPELCFTLVPPGLLVPGYSVEIDEEHVAALALASAEDAVVLVIVTLPPPPQPPTLNLLGPVVVNRQTGAAAQVVQHRSHYGVAVPCVAPSSGVEEG